MKWWKKGAYTITEEGDSLTFSLSDMFTFKLKKVKKSPQEELKLNIAWMWKENQEMLGSLKLFWFFFFNYWNERYWFELEDSDLKADLVENLDKLYF